MTLLNAGTWADSYTKLLAFNLTQYDRVLNLDSDSTVLRPMDELFLVPPAPVAMPKAYWLRPNFDILTSGVLLVQPSKEEYERVVDRIGSAGPSEYDMDILNQLYGSTALVLPHRRYCLVSGEFRSDDHSNYLGPSGSWDAAKIFSEAKFIHFSDWPVPKPWRYMTTQVKAKHQPRCHEVDGMEVCTERQIWTHLYDDFRRRREVGHPLV